MAGGRRGGEGGDVVDVGEGNALVRAICLRLS